MYNMYLYIINYLHALLKCYLNGNMELQIAPLLPRELPGICLTVWCESSFAAFLSYSGEPNYELASSSLTELTNC